jgi:putative hydrolase of the HAD superfamily
MVKYVIFDLDETLYPRGAGLMQEIGVRIMRYLVERMRFTPEQAEEKRMHYYLKYGTSLRGLMAEETVDAEDYLEFVHNIDLNGYIGPNPELDRMLRRIALDKIIFTNSTQEHARRVLDVLGVGDRFRFVVDIRAVDYISKPDPRAYRRLLDLIGAAGDECILVEDNPRNLLPGKALGMTTILVDHGECSEVDYCVKDILSVGDVVARILDSQ